MHLTDIRIDEIVKVDGLPSYARGRATFTNGRSYHFDANFAHGYAEGRIFVWRPTDGRAMDPTTRTAQAIHDRLGFTEIARREREAIAAFEYERVTARPKSSCVPTHPDIRPSGGPPFAALHPPFATSEADPMKITRDFRPLSDRYSFDCGPCSYANGFAQIDTRQDAAHFGTWGSPGARTIVSFCEGDVTTTVCETDAEFSAHLRELARWNDEAGYGPMKIDAVFHDALRQAFEKLGLADLLH